MKMKGPGNIKGRAGLNFVLLVAVIFVLLASLACQSAAPAYSDKTKRQASQDAAPSQGSAARIPEPGNPIAAGEPAKPPDSGQTTTGSISQNLEAAGVITDFQGDVLVINFLGQDTPLRISTATTIQRADGSSALPSDLKQGTKVVAYFSQPERVISWVKIQGTVLQPTSPVEETVVAGVIRGFQKDALSIREEDGSISTVTVDTSTRVLTGDNSTGSAGDLKPGIVIVAFVKGNARIAYEILVGDEVAEIPPDELEPVLEEGVPFEAEVPEEPE